MTCMKKPRSPVILSAAKDLARAMSSQRGPQILRCAQDDMWRQVGNGKQAFRISRIFALQFRGKSG